MFRVLDTDPIVSYNTHTGMMIGSYFNANGRFGLAAGGGSPGCWEPGWEAVGRLLGGCWEALGGSLQ